MISEDLFPTFLLLICLLSSDNFTLPAGCYPLKRCVVGPLDCRLLWCVTFVFSDTRCLLLPAGGCVSSSTGVGKWILWQDLSCCPPQPRQDRPHCVPCLVGGCTECCHQHTGETLCLCCYWNSFYVHFKSMKSSLEQLYKSRTLQMATKILSDPTHLLHNRYYLLPLEGCTECQQ